MEHLSNYHQNHPNKHENSHKLCSETGDPVYWKVNGNWDNNMIRISLWSEAIIEQILASEEINKSKRTGL